MSYMLSQMERLVTAYEKILEIRFHQALASPLIEPSSSNNLVKKLIVQQELQNQTIEHEVVEPSSPQYIKPYTSPHSFPGQNYKIILPRAL